VEYNLQRFIQAQEGVYQKVISELKSGKKRTHWMWFIFPQIEGLGKSSVSQYYAIRNLEEAREYLSHSVLGERLKECTRILLDLEGLAVEDIFGYPDNLKLKSSLTLFALVAGPDSIFERALKKFFSGEKDQLTLKILQKGVPG